MNQFYSSLLMNSKRLPGYQVYKPRYNKEFFKRLTSNSEQLEVLIAKRCKDINLHISKRDIEELKTQSKLLLQLKNRFEKAEKHLDENDTKRWAIKEELEAVEDKILPIVVNIPNRTSKRVPNEDIVLDTIESDFASKEKLTKVLSHTKLSYINNCYSKSVIGPNSHYYFGIGAKLQHGLTNYFTAELEKNKEFIPYSGLCITKSAVIEATNANENKTYTNDPGRILTEHPASTASHLVEASREALLGFITTLGPRASIEPLRLMTSGAGYRRGSDWFDSDDKRITQFETLHALVLNSSIEHYSMNEYNELKDLIWNSYRKLGLPCRLVHCSLNSMYSNEYDTYRIDIWLPSRQEWVQTSRLSHYLDYITIRAGMKRGHIIDSMVFDGQALVAAMIENRQTAMGKFIIPSVIKEHMVCLTKEETNNYFRNEQARQVTDLPLGDQSLLNSNLMNYQQRRYLVKKKYTFGHSKLSAKVRGDVVNYGVIAFCMTLFVIILLDWKEIYYLLPVYIQRFMYNYFYRPSCRMLWHFTHEDEFDDRPFDEIDRTEYGKPMHQRRQEEYLAHNPHIAKRFSERREFFKKLEKSNPEESKKSE